MNIAVFGVGYVGIVQGACLAKLGHRVTCVDIDQDKIQKINNGQMPIFEPGLKEYIQEAQKKNNIFFTSNVKTAMLDAPDIIFICVQTPRDEDGNCNTSYVESVIESIVPHLEKKTLLTIKSTVPPGIRNILEQKFDSPLIEYASNPEFLRQGKAIGDFMNPDRIVLGVGSQWAEQQLRNVYSAMKAPIYVMSIESAQLSKYAANTMLAARLSYMNEIANIADAVGADVQDVEKVVGSDVRIGSKFLRAGAGFGGSCFPKDVLALHYTGKEQGYESLLISPVIEVNNKQPLRFVEKIISKLGDLNGKKLAVWGLAFNAHTDDIRESPAVKIVKILLEKGAEICAFDSRAIEASQAVFGDTIQYVNTREETLPAEAVLVLTEWPEFDLEDWGNVKAKLSTSYVFDGKNFLTRARIQDAKLILVGMGICEEGN